MLLQFLSLLPLLPTVISVPTGTVSTPDSAQTTPPGQPYVPTLSFPYTGTSSIGNSHVSAFLSVTYLNSTDLLLTASLIDGNCADGPRLRRHPNEITTADQVNYPVYLAIEFEDVSSEGWRVGLRRNLTDRCQFGNGSQAGGEGPFGELVTVEGRQVYRHPCPVSAVRVKGCVYAYAGFTEAHFPDRCEFGKWIVNPLVQLGQSISED